MKLVVMVGGGGLWQRRNGKQLNFGFGIYKGVFGMKDTEVNRLVYQDSEAFKKGYEVGFAKACEILHDFAHDVYSMRYAQSDEQAAIENSDQDKAHRFGLCARELEDKVDTWIRENYNYFETDYEEE